MKKIILLLIITLIPSQVFASYIDSQLRDTKNNNVYSTVNKYKKSFEKLDLEKKSIENLKDPKLIQRKTFTEIPDKEYNAKLAKDNEQYKKIQVNIKDYRNVQYYHIYRIAERLIRANNLDYVNWRIAVRKTPDEVNAYSNDGNFVCIYTALYDSLESNDDALAFVIAHEMAHQILGHSQRIAKRAKRHGLIREAIYIKNAKTMEYMADAEAINMIYRAGYSPNKAMEALYMIEAIPNINSVFSSHPVGAKRVESVIENIAILDPYWILEGKQNIYNSEVLSGKKSGDRVSVLISKSNTTKNFYQAETYKERLTRVAYMNYLNGNMEKAAKYFGKIAKSTGSYEHYLYASYANQYVYQSTSDTKYLKHAIQAAEEAQNLSPDNNLVKEQILEVKRLDSI